MLTETHLDGVNSPPESRRSPQAVGKTPIREAGHKTKALSGKVISRSFVRRWGTGGAYSDKYS